MSKGLAQGRALRDAGIDKVLEAEKAQWRGYVDDAVAVVAARGKEFTSDDSGSLMDSWGIPAPHHPNAIGATFRSAAMKVAKPTGRYIQSIRPNAHARTIRVWRPL